MAKKIIVIGGVAAGAKTASRIKRRDPEIEVIMLERGKMLSYGACGLPYFVSDIVEDHKELMSTPIGVVRDESFFRDVKGVTSYIRVTAEEIEHIVTDLERMILEYCGGETEVDVLGVARNQWRL